MAPILQLRELGLEQIPAGAPAGPSCATLYLRDSLSLVSELLCMHLLGVTTNRKAKRTLAQPESCF